jgi:hypothetical protein
VAGVTDSTGECVGVCAGKRAREVETGRPTKTDRQTDREERGERREREREERKGMGKRANVKRAESEGEGH